MSNVVGAVAGDWLERLADAMARGAGKILEWTLTWWVHDDAPRVDGSASVAVWLQDRLLWLTMAAAVLGLLVGAARIALSGGPRAAREVAEGMTRLVVVAALAIPVISALTVAGDKFSEWILHEVDPAALGYGFFDLSTTGGGAINATFGPAVLVFVAFVGLLVGLAQILLMLVRAAMLVILAGVLPTLAASSMTESGMQAYKKALAWTVAFLLYKPLAAIIYAAAFKGLSRPAGDDGIGVAEAQIIGVLTLMLALVALPALMRAVAPVMAHVATGGGGAKMAGAAGLASGARSFSGGAAGSRSGAGAAAGGRPGGGRVPAGATAARGAAGAVAAPVLIAQAAHRLGRGVARTAQNSTGSGPSGSAPPGPPPPGGRPPGRT